MRALSLKKIVLTPNFWTAIMSIIIYYYYTIVSQHYCLIKVKESSTIFTKSEVCSFKLSVSLCENFHHRAELCNSITYKMKRSSSLDVQSPSTSWEYSSNCLQRYQHHHMPVEQCFQVSSPHILWGFKRLTYLCSQSLRYFSRSALLSLSRGWRLSLCVFTFWLSM